MLFSAETPASSERGPYQAVQRWGGELKNVTDRVCNAYSKLRNVATAEIIRTASYVLVVDIWRLQVVQNGSREASCGATDVYCRAISTCYAAVS